MWRSICGPSSLERYALFKGPWCRVPVVCCGCRPLPRRRRRRRHRAHRRARHADLGAIGFDSCQRRTGRRLRHQLPVQMPRQCVQRRWRWRWWLCGSSFFTSCRRWSDSGDGRGRRRSGRTYWLMAEPGRGWGRWTYRHDPPRATFRIGFRIRWSWRLRRWRLRQWRGGAGWHVLLLRAASASCFSTPVASS